MLSPLHGALLSLLFAAQVILARILLITKEHVFVDTGFHSVSEMPRADLDINDVQVRAPFQH